MVDKEVGHCFFLCLGKEVGATSVKDALVR